MFACGGVEAQPGRDAGVAMGAGVTCEAGPSPACGAGVTELPGLWDPRAFRVDSSGVYFVGATGDPNTSQPGLYRATTDLSSATPLLDDFLGQLAALDDDSVYFTTSTSSGTTVQALPKAGGPSVTLATGIRDTGSNGVGPVFVLPEGQTLYLSAVNAGTIAALPKTGGTPRTIVSATAPVAFGLDDAELFWSGTEAGATLEASPIGGGTPRVLDGAARGIDTAVLFGGTVYFSSAGHLWSVPKSGGHAALLADFGSYELATDGTWLYARQMALYGGPPPEPVVRLSVCGGSIDTSLMGGPSGVFALQGSMLYWEDWLRNGFAYLFASCS